MRASPFLLSVLLFSIASSTGYIFPESFDAACNNLFAKISHENDDCGRGRLLKHFALLPEYANNTRVRTSEENIFYLRPCIIHVNSTCHVRDLSLHVSLEGPTIVSGEATPDQCNIRVKFVLYEPGKYRINMKLRWLHETTTHPEYLGAQKNPNIEPFGMVHVRESRCLEQESVFVDGPMFVHAVGDSFLASRGDVPLCNTTSGFGQWYNFEDSKGLGFTGDPAWLDDGLVWIPHSCKLHIYSPDEIEQCFQEKGIHTVLVWGDSLPREHVQNLRQYINGSRTTFMFADMSLGGQGLRNDLDDIFSHILPSVLITNFNIYHIVKYPYDLDSFRTTLENFAQVWKNYETLAKRTKLFVHLGPSVHACNGYELITNSRVQQYNDIMVEYLVPLGFDALFNDKVTHGRPDKSHDGVHYSISKYRRDEKTFRNPPNHIPHPKTTFGNLTCMTDNWVGDVPWLGSVSNMMTIMLVNMLCN